MASFCGNHVILSKAVSHKSCKEHKTTQFIVWHLVWPDNDAFMSWCLHDREICESRMELRFNGYCVSTACSGNWILNLCLMFKRSWVDDWYHFFCWGRPKASRTLQTNVILSQNPPWLWKLLDSFLLCQIRKMYRQGWSQHPYIPKQYFPSGILWRNQDRSNIP